MEQLFEFVGNGIGNGVSWLASHGVLFGIFFVIWVALGVAYVHRHESIDDAWRRIRELPLVAQLTVWLLLLPVMVGLWIWEQRAWPLLARATLILGIAGWNLVVFVPTTAVP